MSSFTSSRSAVSLSSSTWFQMRLKIKKKASIKLTWSISSTRRLCIARQVAWRASNMDRSFKWEINYRAWKFESTLHTSGCSRPGLSSDSISEKTAMFCCVTPRSPLTFATCSGCMSARGGIFHCSQYYGRICFRGNAIWIRFKTTRSALTCRSCKEFLKEVLLLYMSARTHLLFWIMHLKTVPRFTWGVLSSMSVCHKV